MLVKDYLNKINLYPFLTPLQHTDLPGYTPYSSKVPPSPDSSLTAVTFFKSSWKTINLPAHDQCSTPSVTPTRMSDIRTSGMSSKFKMEVTGPPETLVPIHQTTRHLQGITSRKPVISAFILLQWVFKFKLMKNILL
jgi:hypothetical protein